FKLGGVELQGGRLGSDRNCFLDLTGFQYGIHRQVCPGWHRSVFLHESVESLELHGDTVCAGLHQVEQVATVVVGLPDRGSSGFAVEQSYRGSNDGTLARIRDSSLDSAAVFLTKH